MRGKFNSKLILLIICIVSLVVQAADPPKKKSKPKKETVKIDACTEAFSALVKDVWKRGAMTMVVTKDGHQYPATDFRFLEGLARSFYNRGELADENLRGKTVLDMGCGPAGVLVDDLLYAGAKEAFGIDLYIEDKANAHLKEADIEAMPFGNSEFDAIFSTWSLFTWRKGLSEEKMTRSLKEINRVLKSGGACHISPVTDKTITEIKSVIDKEKLPLEINFYNTGSPYVMGNQTITLIKK
jgi:SAM-dependent methyltransferase